MLIRTSDPAEPALAAQKGIALAAFDLLVKAATRRRKGAVAAAVVDLERQNTELRQEQLAMRAWQWELEHLDAVKEDLVATVAHEMRTPLATLEMSLAILGGKPEISAADRGRRCEAMRRQTRQLMRIVDNLLEVAAAGPGKAALHLVAADLNSLVSQAAEMCAAPIDQKSHGLTMQMLEDPVWVSADWSRLTQVVCNLVQNASRYTRAQGALVVRVRREETEAVIEVEDNGMGIAAGDLPHIFDLFVRSERTRALGEGGLGVGLAVVRRVVEDHGGTVSAQSGGIDQGSRFTVRLPLLAVPIAASVAV